jgi:hypothetical protein
MGFLIQQATWLLISSFSISAYSAMVHSALIEVEVILRPTVSWPVRLGVRHPSGTRDQFLFLLEIFFRQLRGCYFVAPFLTRGRVCNLLLWWSLPAQSRSDLSPTGLKTTFYCPNSWDSPNLEGQVSVFISPRNRVAQLYPRALGSLSIASYVTTHRATVEVFYPTSTWVSQL